MRYLNKNRRIQFNSLAVILFYIFVPALAFAATIDDIVTTVKSILAILGPLIIGLALLFFFWGLAMFILHAGDEAKRAEGRSIMVWGIIALFVIVAVWGLVAVLAATTKISTGGGAPIPTLPQ